MPDFLELVFNPYDRAARLRPALLATLPLLVSIVLLIPEFDSTWATVGGLVLYCGGTTFLTQAGRDRGKRMERALFKSWGGKPSTAMLRHSDTRITAATKERYRNFLSSVVPGLTLASEEQERRCPEDADDAYESAIDWLLTQTRDRGRFQLLFRENINYGFRRNIWALKSWALLVAGVTVASVVVLISNHWTGEPIATAYAVGVQTWASFGVALAHALTFMFIVRRKWIRLVAEAYAQQLLAACDTLESERKD